MCAAADIPLLEVSDRAELRTWLEANHATSDGVRIARLAAQRLMTPAGLAAVDAAKADGSWTKLDDAEG